MSERRIPDAWPRGMRLDVAVAYVGMSRSTFLREVDAGRAPQSYPATPGTRVWLREELDDYLDRIAGKVKPSGDEAGKSYPDPLAGLVKWHAQ